MIEWLYVVLLSFYGVLLTCAFILVGIVSKKITALESEVIWLQERLNDRRGV